MNKATTALLAFSLLLLAGAMVASRVMLSNVEAPPVTLPRPVPIAVAPPPPPPAPAPVAIAQPVAMPPPLPTDVPVAAPPAPPPAQPPPVYPPAVDSDYAQENSPQVEEAWTLARSKDPSAWRRAEKIFKRCLVQVPQNQRCQSGLATVQAQLLSGQPGPRPANEAVPRVKGARPQHRNSYEDE